MSTTNNHCLLDEISRYQKLYDICFSKLSDILEKELNNKNQAL